MARNKQWDWRKGLVGTSKRREAPFPTLGDIQVTHIDKVLQAYGYNFVHAALALGISRATLYRRMQGPVSPTRLRSLRTVRKRQLALARAARA